MNAVSKSRDMKVLELLDKHKYATTDQVAELLFTSIKDPRQRLQKATQRLKVLFDHGLVQRMRIPGHHYIYTVRGPKYTHLVNHYLAIMDIWIALSRCIPAGSVLRHEVEMKAGDIVCDLWVEHKNSFRGVRKEYFIEVELNSSGDVAEKIRKYEGLAWSRAGRGEGEFGVVVAYVNQRTVARLSESNAGKVDLRAVYLPEFTQEWKWL